MLRFSVSKVTKVFTEYEVRWRKKVTTPADAARFLDAVGYCLLFPIKNLPLPSLYYAVSRKDDPDWDQYARKIWEWKDELPRKRRAFYGKYFKGRGSFISLEMLPRLLAMHDTAAEPDDYESFYAAGRIRADARAVWEALAKHGPLATLELRHACKMEATTGNVGFKRAMLDLQRLLLVVHFGAEQETAAWASGRFELTCRAFPRETAAARRISKEAARAAIAAKYLEWHPGATPALLARLFAWSKDEALAAHNRSRTDAGERKRGDGS